ncbi:MAG: ABC transporter ATP-binding protein [Spirochaetales bacterium]|nr:ABC transporter ATP-binding protein [Spirochaetales bacterium]
MNIVAIEGLTRKFGDIAAVDNMNLTIREGEIYGLLGPNGAGKSTLINILSGLLKMNSGKVELMGMDIRKGHNNLKKKIGVVPQDIAIYEDLTARENVNFFSGLYGCRGTELKQNVIEALAFVGLIENADKFPKAFSGGMKRRLNIACAIAHKPELIIMDEPTVGIDPQSRNHILESVKELNRRGSTIIYTSHYMEEIEAVCDRAGIIDHGKLIAEGTGDELKAIVSDKQFIIIGLENADGLDVSQLQEIDGIVNVLKDGNIIKIENTKVINNWDKIIRCIDMQGVRISNIESRTPTLETVFLTLTGRTLRD